MHCEGIIRLFHQYVSEQWGGPIPSEVAERIERICNDIVVLVDAFIDQAFELGPVKGMEADDIKRYIRYIADWRLGQLGLRPIYGIKTHPLPWLTPLLNGVEHANFFEQRATEYSKGATKGTWNDVWRSIDERNGERSGVDALAVGDSGQANPSVRDGQHGGSIDYGSKVAELRT